MTTKLPDRLTKILEAEMPAARRYKDLEEKSGIGSHSWIAISRGRQRPTSEMIEFVAKQWPDYAYWLATGVTEPQFRHVAPVTYSEEYPVFRGEKSEVASAARRYEIERLKKMPAEAAERAAYVKALHDEVVQLQENEKFLADFHAYRRHARLMGSEGPDSLYMAAQDPELQALQQRWYEEDKDLWTKLSVTRANIQTGKWVRKVMEPVGQLLNWLRK